MKKFLACLILLFWPISGWAANKWHITADTLIFLKEKKQLIAQGNVIVKDSRITVYCSRLIYELPSKIATLFGPITIKTDSDTIKSSYGWLNLESYKGEFKDVHLYLAPGRVKALAFEMTKVQILAKKIKVLGQENYLAQKTIITTCDICEHKKCSPDWSFRARKLKVSPTGRASARDITFNVKKLPLFYSPYLSIGVKTKRHSGFLLPRLVQGSREGFGLEIPYFWAINDSLDLTFYSFYTGKRGFMAGLEGNYALTSKSFGTFRARYIKDRLKDDDYNSDGIIRDNENRYWITGKFDQEIARGWPLRLDIDILSDKDFLYEFLGGPLGFDQSHSSYLNRFGRGLDEKNSFYRTNRLWLTHPFGHYFFQASSTYYDSSLPDRQEKILNPLLRVDFSRLTAPFLGPLNFSLRENYVYWWREEDFRGHRLDLTPEISLSPSFWKPLDLRIAYRLIHTSYLVDWQDERQEEYLERTIQELEVQTGLNISRIYSFNRFGVIGFKHVLRPQIAYLYRPHTKQDDLPTFTAEDRLPKMNVLNYGLLQFVTAKEKTSEGNIRYSDWVRIWIHQSFDFEEATRELEGPDDKRRPFSNLFAEGEINLLKQIYIRASTSYNFYGLGWATANLSADLRNQKGENIGFDYRWDKVRQIKQINLRLRKNVYRGFWFAYSANYSLKEKELSSSSMAFEYRSKCWWAVVRVYYNPDETRYSFYINLVGIGGWGR
ncbi:LPS-assembly protein LptD [Thermodesulfatator autotrophicus]|uniref:LptD C-terminal domain-containing protein n=1 Tax=Thermodesulfatator autotrophicus TaxID=1795632 RepID=A0A177E9W3_9BACT|nr:LPS assembly protein LptD [Thermodesulfatator autotrophicus]OAG28734.1 hypothetical protein TH606_00270 [Thermodesulfatator autotrophicus]